MNMEMSETDFSQFIKALRFAAKKHMHQRRKGGTHAPYINHPIAVADILWQAGVRDTHTLVAALLHDTVEDTDTPPEEIRAEFGEDVLALVMEVTDDKSQPKEERKRLQIVEAPHKSPRARQIKLADKINNVIEIANDPPLFWTQKRRREYLNWTEQVINGLRGLNPVLEKQYDEVLAAARAKLK